MTDVTIQKPETNEQEKETDETSDGNGPGNAEKTHKNTTQTQKAAMTNTNVEFTKGLCDSARINAYPPYRLDEGDGDLIMSFLLIVLFVGIMLKIKLLVWIAMLACVSNWSLAENGSQFKSFWSVIGLAGMSVFSLYVMPAPGSRRTEKA
eukprot:Selendium_serpulae@DN6219_c2_g2_i3.p1